MSGILLTLLVSLVAVALMIIGLVITRMRRGCDIRRDVGNNEEMQKRGLECAEECGCGDEGITVCDDCSDCAKEEGKA